MPTSIADLIGSIESDAEAVTATAVASSALHRLEEVSRLLNCLVAEWGDNVTFHRRSELRTLFTDPLVLTPFDAGSDSPNGEPRLVTGRNVSLHGISFEHETPLPHRDIVLTFALPGGNVESIVTRLMWCRFNRDGRYQSGGRLMRSIASPIGSDVDWNLLRRA